MRIAWQALHVGHITWIGSSVIGCEEVYSHPPALDEQKSGAITVVSNGNRSPARS